MIGLTDCMGLPVCCYVKGSLLEVSFTSCFISNLCSSWLSVECFLVYQVQIKKKTISFLLGSSPLRGGEEWNADAEEASGLGAPLVRRLRRRVRTYELGTTHPDAAENFAVQQRRGDGSVAQANIYPPVQFCSSRFAIV